MLKQQRQGHQVTVQTPWGEPSYMRGLEIPRWDHCSQLWLTRLKLKCHSQVLFDFSEESTALMSHWTQTTAQAPFQGHSLWHLPSKVKDWYTQKGKQLSPQMKLWLQTVICQVSISSSLCHHLITGLTPPASQVPSCVGSNHALYTLLKKIHLSPDRPVSLFIKSVLLVSFSFCPLLFLPFDLHSFPPIIQLSLPFFFTTPFYISILCPSFFVSSLLFPEAVPLLPASVVSEGWGKRCTSAIS